VDDFFHELPAVRAFAFFGLDHHRSSDLRATEELFLCGLRSAFSGPSDPNDQLTLRTGASHAYSNGNVPDSHRISSFPALPAADTGA